MFNNTSILQQMSPFSSPFLPPSSYSHICTYMLGRGSSLNWNFPDNNFWKFHSIWIQVQTLFVHKIDFKILRKGEALDVLGFFFSKIPSKLKKISTKEDVWKPKTPLPGYAPNHYVPRSSDVTPEQNKWSGIVIPMEVEGVWN